jgi:hypothetical protein
MILAGRSEEEMDFLFVSREMPCGDDDRFTTFCSPFNPITGKPAACDGSSYSGCLS